MDTGKTAYNIIILYSNGNEIKSKCCTVKKSDDVYVFQYMNVPDVICVKSLILNLK